MSDTVTPRDAPARDGRRWVAAQQASHHCGHCPREQVGTLGVTWTAAGWAADWRCEACDTTTIASCSDARIGELNDAVGPWLPIAATGGTLREG